MSSTDGPKRDPRSERSEVVAENRQSASLDRAAGLVDALMQRALRHERVLEVLDLKAARSERQLAQALRGAATRWASAGDVAARSDAASELLELLDAAEAVLLFGGPPPSSDRRDSARPAPSGPAAVTEADFEESGVRGVPAIELAATREPATSPSDQSFWKAMLGGTSRGKK